MSSVSETVCVTGVTGFVGSWLVKMLIEQGYTVRATVRNPGNMKKVKHLVELADAETKLSLWKADLTEEGSFDEAINGCSGVFHVATPVDFESNDPQNEVIKPSINGVLDIMKSCLKAKTVRRVIYTSSASAAMVSKDKRLLLDETCCTDVDFCQTHNMDASMYFLLSKTLAEQEAWKFAKEHNIDFITILPTLITGPFITPTVPHSVTIALSPITVSKTVCVTGADGYIGSWLVKRLIEQGYTVRATIYPANMKNVKHLLELPDANTKLTLWEADMTEEGSFDEAIKGCSGVFHLATPMDFESKDPENEIIKPTIKGVLDIMRSCLKAKTVRRMIYTSSAGAVNLSEHKTLLFDENSWTDVQYCRTLKMTGWMYFVSKTLAEQEAWKFAKEHNIDLITTLPTLVIGPFIVPTMPPSLITALSPITGNEAHYSIIKQGQFVHLDDLCGAHIFLLEHPKAEGRYICSGCDATIHQIAKLINQKYPEYKVPTKFENIPDELELIRFSSKKLIDLGFQFKYTLEDMYTGAIDTCREKGLIPKSAPPQTPPPAN